MCLHLCLCLCVCVYVGAGTFVFHLFTSPPAGFKRFGGSHFLERECEMKVMQNPTAALLAHESKIVFLTQHVVADELGLSSVQAEKSFRNW